MKITINNKIFCNESKIITYTCDRCSTAVNCNILYTCQDGDITQKLCKKCFEVSISENANLPSPTNKTQQEKSSSQDNTPIQKSINEKNKVHEKHKNSKKTPEKFKKKTSTSQKSEPNSNYKKSSQKIHPIYLKDGEIILGIPSSHSCVRETCGKLIKEDVLMYDTFKIIGLRATIYRCPLCNKKFMDDNTDIHLFSKQYTFLNENLYFDQQEEYIQTQRKKHPSSPRQIIIKRAKQDKYRQNTEDFEYWDKQLHRDSSKTGNSLSKHDLQPQQVLVMVNTFHCTNNNHILKDILIVIKIITPNGNIKKIEYPGAYCATCQRYYILNKDFLEIKKIGIPVCRVVDVYHKQTSDEFNNSLNEESLLHILGYNVNAQIGLTQERRWQILEKIVDADILTKNEICSHLDYLINRSKHNSLMNNAIAKWKIDREHISQYQHQNLEKIEVIQFKRNVYK